MHAARRKDTLSHISGKANRQPNNNTTACADPGTNVPGVVQRQEERDKYIARSSDKRLFSE